MRHCALYQWIELYSNKLLYDKGVMKKLFVPHFFFVNNFLQN